MAKACSSRPGFQEKNPNLSTQMDIQRVLPYTHILWFHIPEKNSKPVPYDYFSIWYKDLQNMASAAGPKYPWQNFLW